MKPSRMKEVLIDVLKTRWPVFIWGPPGVGKSSLVKEIASNKNIKLLDVRASLLDPTDLRGIPYVTSETAKWAPPAFLPYDKKSEGILFFDELNAAPPLVQASLYQLTLDRRLGEYELPEKWRILAAGNRAEDASLVFRMPAALSNRFIHLDFEHNLEDWRNWAIDNKTHPLVLGFLGTRGEMLFKMSSSERAFPTPRSWEILSDQLQVFDNYKHIEELMTGTIGEAATIEFMAYCRNALSEKEILKIIKDPEKAKMPEKLSDIYALISYLISRNEDDEVLDAGAKLLNRLSPEMAVLLLRDFLRANPKFAMKPSYQKFVMDHGDLLG
jgi:hypothetical protein